MQDAHKDVSEPLDAPDQVPLVTGASITTVTRIHWSDNNGGQRRRNTRICQQPCRRRV